MKFFSSWLIILLFSHSLLFAQEDPPTPGNILLIVSDDQRFDQVDPFMPNVRDRIFNKGIVFNRGYVTTPACCPSRSSILTGLYTSSHQVIGNAFPLKVETIFEHLQGEYFQGIIGKYLNSWSGDYRSEFDFWAVFRGGSSRFFNPNFNVNGVWSKYEGHINPIISAFAVDFIEQAKESEKPFFLALTYNSPHDPADPEEQDIGRFDHIPFKFTNNFDRFDAKKPLWVRKKKSFSDLRLQLINSSINQRRETIFSMDRSIGLVLDKLESEDMLSNTLIFFLSDNGLFYGEHRLLSKNAAYEGAIHVPFGLRYDNGNLLQRETDVLVANVDIAPTIADFTNKPMDREFDGVSLLPLFQEDQPVRQNLFLEEWRGYNKIGTKKEFVRRPFRAVHNGRFVLIKTYPVYDRYSLEFYDLKRDPNQLNNIFHTRKKKRLKKRWLKIIKRKQRIVITNEKEQAF